MFKILFFIIAFPFILVASILVLVLKLLFLPFTLLFGRHHCHCHHEGFFKGFLLGSLFF